MHVRPYAPSRAPFLRSPRARILLSVTATALMAVVGVASFSGPGRSAPSHHERVDPQVLRGRLLVASLSCTECHNRGKDDPNDPHWLAGFIGPAGGQGPGTFQIGPFQTYAANLTPDRQTGLGSFTSRQIYNALRYGLDPMFTPSVVITTRPGQEPIPGEGNFPQVPHYLAPPMPWPSFRHLPKEDLQAIVAYLKQGIKPVSNEVPDSQGPPDFWASSYTPDQIGPFHLPKFPAGNETDGDDDADDR